MNPELHTYLGLEAQPDALAEALKCWFAAEHE